MSNKYIEMFGKKYLKCTSCSHFNNESNRCKMFDVACARDDGCTLETIKQAEKIIEIEY